MTIPTVVTVTHGSYGCDCNCCGHYIEVDGHNGDNVDRTFMFDHDVGKILAIAYAQAAKYGAAFRDSQSYICADCELTGQ